MTTGQYALLSTFANVGATVDGTQAGMARLTEALNTKTHGIGDVNSTGRGSGARYNAGKPALELVPLRLVADSLMVSADRIHPEGEPSWLRDTGVATLYSLADFQERHGTARQAINTVLSAGADAAWSECAQVFDYGRLKYTGWNWARGMPWSAVIGSCARHLLAMCRGEVLDPESDLPHRGHVMCNLVMLATYDHTYPEGDDRAPQGALA